MRAFAAALLAALLAVAAAPAAHGYEYQVRPGAPTRAEAWPYVVQVRVGSSHCTGVLVAAGWALTAAHCGGNATEVSVIGPRTGADDPTWTSAGKVLRHPAWHPSGSVSTRTYDLALVRLATAHRFNGPPLMLATSGDSARWAPGERIRFAGWGRTDRDAEPRQLHDGEARVAGEKACRTNSTDLCLAGGGSSLCFGDSGGPMIDEGGLLVAISVRAMEGCRDRSFGALVAPALPWIEETIGRSEARVAGRNRYETAAAVAESWRSADTVYVSSGESPVDAIAAGPAAATIDAPVLMTPRDALHPTVRSAIGRLRPRSIVVVGGRGAVADQVVDQLRRLAPVQRIAGTDRYATAAALAQESGRPRGVVYISADDPRDPITTASIAASVGASFLLADLGDSMHPAVDAALEDLRPRRIVIVGPAAAISERFLESAGARGPVEVYGAADHEHRVSRLVDDLPDDPTAIVLAASSAPSDALSGIAATALSPPAPLLLVEVRCLPATVHGLVEHASVTLLGGSAALPDGVRNWSRC